MPRIASFFISLSLSWTSLGAVTRVVIDPGHGGADQGATTHRVHEAEITLQVAQKLAAILKQDRRFSPYLTRQQDQHLDLEERTELVERYQGDLFVSIHANASVDSRARGLELYFQNQLPPDKDSFYLAHKENAGQTGGPATAAGRTDVEVIVDDLHEQHRIKRSAELAKALYRQWLGRRKRSKRHSVKQAPFYVISQNPAPAVLVELGFLTNSHEETQLRDPAYQKLLARSIHRGLVNYLEIIDNQP